MRCFACDAEITATAEPCEASEASERVGFRDTCEACDADLHVCLNCLHHDPQAYNECRESSAERVSERDRANRCEYFAPRPSPRSGPGAPADAAARARAELDALFKK